jgi:hypothetical protein
MRFVAMDEFQRSFFLKRQEEWQPYLNMVEGLIPKQGDLQDSSYFDFISFSQYKSLGEAMLDGRMAYVERVGAEGELVTRRRPADVPENNALLPAEHRKRVGDFIYGWASESYEIKPARRFADIETSARMLLEIFRIRGFAQSSSLQLSRDGEGQARLECTLGAPATLWSQRVLERATLRNDFEMMMLEAHLRACGAQPVSLSTRFSPVDIRHTLKLVLPSE